MKNKKFENGDIVSCIVKRPGGGAQLRTGWIVQGSLAPTGYVYDIALDWPGKDMAENVLEDAIFLFVGRN